MSRALLALPDHPIRKSGLIETLAYRQVDSPEIALVVPMEVEVQGRVVVDEALPPTAYSFILAFSFARIGGRGAAASSVFV